MGAGCALRAKVLWPGIQLTLGKAIRDSGNHVHLLTEVAPNIADEGYTLQLPNWGLYPPHPVPYHVVSFPTKNHWKENSDLALIKQSAAELLGLATKQGWTSVVVPRPGCGLGNLDWDRTVRPLLVSLWDDRFFVIDFKKE